MGGSGVFRWFFADRRTGEITIAQRPNALSSLAMASAVASVSLPGRPGRAAAVVRETSMAAWGLDELLRGVNPWRRAMGSASLAGQGARLWRRSGR